MLKFQWTAQEVPKFMCCQSQQHSYSILDIYLFFSKQSGYSHGLILEILFGSFFEVIPTCHHDF